MFILLELIVGGEYTFVKNHPSS